MLVRPSPGEGKAAEAPDEELLAGVWAGLLNAAEALYDRHSRELFSYAFWHLRDRSESEDLVQEAFLRLLASPSARPPSSVRAFLYAVVRNLIVDVLRKASVQRKHLGLVRQTTSEEAAWGDPVPTELQKEALAEVHRLPDDLREPVLLKIFGQLTFPQVAEVLDLPEGTVASRYRSALGELARRLGEKRGAR